MRELSLNWPEPRVQSQDVCSISYLRPTKVINSLFSSLRKRGPSASPPHFDFAEAVFQRTGPVLQNL